MDERDLDSERSEDEDREKKDPYDIEYDEQVRKMSVLFSSYFENVETMQKRGGKNAMRAGMLSAVKKPII
jgi:hypothetical protein